MPVILNILQHARVASVLQCEGSEGRVLWKCFAQEQISMANSNDQNSQKCKYIAQKQQRQK